MRGTRRRTAAFGLMTVLLIAAGVVGVERTFLWPKVRSGPSSRRSATWTPPDDLEWIQDHGRL